MATAVRKLRTTPSTPKRPPITFWHGSVKECLEVIQREYADGGEAGWTVRHYKYQLGNTGLLKLDPHYKTSEDNAYNWVVNLLVKAREDGRIPWAAVVDEGRSSPYESPQESLRKHIQAIADDYYWINFWRGQPNRLDLFTEKEGLEAALNAVARRFGVKAYATKGYASVDQLHDTAECYRKRLERDGQTTTVLWVGDLDPLGVDITRNFYAGLCKYGYRSTPPIRIAVLPEHVPGLPAEARQPFKMGDKSMRTKVERFRRDYPMLDCGWQVEAIPARRLRELVEQAIRAHLDVHALNTAVDLTLAVRSWISDSVREAITNLESLRGDPLHKAILRPGQLIDPRTEQPFSADVVQRYLSADEEDDEEEDDDEDTTPADAGTVDNLAAAEAAAWDAYQAAEGDPNADPAEVERLEDVWFALRKRLRGNRSGAHDEEEDS